MMWQAVHCLSIRAIQADALFVSGLQRSKEPSCGQVRRAVVATIRAFGCSGCGERVAQELGDRPETAAIRMRWARLVAREAFAESASELGLHADDSPSLFVHPWLPAVRAPDSQVGLTATGVGRGD